jgi:hypothetical protein
MEHDRTNKETEAAVNRGLAAALFGGLAAGARVMRDEQVPLHVARRVLLRPRLRRATDWRH